MIRVPYLDLPLGEKLAIHDWLTEHHVDYTRVPVWAQFEYDETTGEWLIPVYRVDDDGHMRLAGADDVRRHVVRRRELRPLPWREREDTWTQEELDAAKERGRIMAKKFEELCD